MGAFSAKFSTPPSGKTMNWTQKRMTLNDGLGHLYHRAKFDGNRATDVGVRGRNVVFFYFLPAGSAAGSSAGISLTHGPILGFFAPQGRHVAPIKVKFGTDEGTVGPLLSAKFDLDRFRGGGLRPPKLKKIGIFPI